MLYETAEGQEKNFSHQYDTGKGKAHRQEILKISSPRGAFLLCNENYRQCR